MARRSPMNERYQKNTAPAGKTRKSAAAAKPKRQSSAGAPAAKKSASKSGSSQSRSAMAVNPQTPEFRFWRRIWWVLLGTSMVLAGSTWLLLKNPALEQYGRYGLFLSYVLIGAALFLDLTKLRRMRQEWIDGEDQAKKPKGKSDSAAKDEAVSTDTTADTDTGSSEDKS